MWGVSQFRIDVAEVILNFLVGRAKSLTDSILLINSELLLLDFGVAIFPD